MGDSHAGLPHAFIADPWFSQLDAAVRQRFLAAARPIQLRAGAFAFRQGDLSDGLLGVANGMLKASTLREDGKEAILAVLEAGNWFGETSCVDHEPRRHDVVALTACTLLHVGQRELDDLLDQEGIAQALLRLGAIHMRAVYTMIEDATLRSTRARVARRLRRLSSGDVSPGIAPRLSITVTHETLAMMLGITRQTLALELKALTNAGIIATGYGRIGIKSLERLRALESEP